MCGFVGILRRDSEAPVERGELARMLAPIAYRGPDGDGYRTEPGVGLGFCRLAIVDPAGGHQPLANEDGTVWIVFNGEIYNHAELAVELRARGHRFRTHADTEAIVHAYEEWGPAAVERLRGIFAFAIWDAPRRRLFLARDRSGIKPLHLAWCGGRGGDLLFGSEAKALLASGRLPHALDVIGYLGGDEVDPDLARTAFAGVLQLGAGCLAEARAGEELRVRRYWHYAPTRDGVREGGAIDAEAIVESFREVLEEAVAMQLMADVPVAASLSGGVDSSAIVAAIVRRGRRDVRTYTVTFDQDQTGDPIHARRLAAELGIALEEVPVGLDAATLALLPEVAWAAEGELDLGFLARYQLARAVHRDGAKVLLSGQGIDEILTGYYASYEAYRRVALERRLRTRLRPSYRGLPVFADRVLDELGGLGARGLGGEPPERGWAEITSEQLRADHSRLDSGLLRFEDRMGMAGHVEVRVPFLDHRLVELCAAIPEEGRPELLSRKNLLRRAVAPWLPAEIRERPKVGFNASALPVSRVVEAWRGGALPAAATRAPRATPAPETDEVAAELAALLSREVVERKGYFGWRYCQGLRQAGDWARLDHVLLLHLLDELFVERRGERFVSPASAVTPTPAVAAGTGPGEAPA